MERSSSPYAEQLRAFALDARNLSEDELRDRLNEAAHALDDLRRKVDETSAWLEALSTERDRRVIQRRAQ